MQVTIKVEGLEEVRKKLGSLAKQANFAASKALDTTAFAINGRLKEEMKSVFKGGATGFTQRSFKVEKSSKKNLVSTVFLRTDAPEGGANYSAALAHLFTGGRRKYKQLEGWLRARRLIPSGLTVAPGPGMPLDKYGNMKRDTLKEMLGVIGSQMTNLRVYQKNGRKQAPKAVGYFVVLPGDKSRKHPGIYKRIQTGATSTIKPMVMYIDPTNYRKFIDLEKLGNEVVSKTFNAEFNKELEAAIATAK